MVYQVLNKGFSWDLGSPFYCYCCELPEELLIHGDHSLVVAHLFEPLLPALVRGAVGIRVVRQEGVSLQSDLG